MSAASARGWCLALALCGIVVALDQGAKAAIESNLVPGEDVDVLGPLTLTNVHNEGVAFGVAGGSGTGIMLLSIGALVLILALFARSADRPGMWVAVGLLIGGALGNLADRVRIDAVTDFIDLPLWPAFNIADIAITAGVAMLAWLMLTEGEREKTVERRA